MQMLKKSGLMGTTAEWFSLRIIALYDAVISADGLYKASDRCRIDFV